MDDDDDDDVDVDVGGARERENNGGAGEMVFFLNNFAHRQRRDLCSDRQTGV